MQSLSSKVRPSLNGPFRWQIRKNDQIIMAPHHLCRRPLWISDRGVQSTKSLLARQFSEKRSTAGTSSSASNHSRRSYVYSFFDWYSKKLDTDPILTKCISAGLVSSVGSVLAQYITHRQEQQEHADDKNKNNQSEQKPFEVNLAHVSRFALLNVAIVAPVLHQWYQFINRAVPGTTFPRVLQRTFWDEFVFSPIYIPAFLGMLWKLEGYNNDNILKMIKSEFPTIIVTEWAMWVPTMIVTFRYVPVKFQVLVVNVVGVVWQTYLAYAAINADSSSSEIESDEDKDKSSETKSERKL